MVTYTTATMATAHIRLGSAPCQRVANTCVPDSGTCTADPYGAKDTVRVWSKDTHRGWEYDTAEWQEYGLGGTLG
jgi:hypothetical protein